MNNSKHVIGILPAAGRGSRMAHLAHSKELLPLNRDAEVEQPSYTAIDGALETMALAGVDNVCIVVAPTKTDIVTHVGDGRRLGVSVHFAEIDNSPDVPTSLDSAYPFAGDNEVALLFPDIVFEPGDALSQLLHHRRSHDSDVTLALVPAPSATKIDLVTARDDGEVLQVTAKPGADCSGWTWIAAVWNARFTDFLHSTVESSGQRPSSARRERYVADVLNAAVTAGLSVRSLPFPQGRSFDLGTPDELQRYRDSGLP